MAIRPEENLQTHCDEIESALAMLLSAYQAATGDRESAMVTGAASLLEGLSGLTTDGRKWTCLNGRVTWG